MGRSKPASKRQKIETLSVRNAHPRDARIVFYEKPHLYEVDGSSTGYTSITTWIHQWFPHFNGPAVCRKMLCKPGWLTNPKYEWVVMHAHAYLKHSASCDRRERRAWGEFCELQPTGPDLDTMEPRPYLRWRIGRASWEEEPLFAELKAAILESWERNRQQASDEGTLMHAIIEYYFVNDSSEEALQNIRVFLKWRHLNKMLHPHFSREADEDSWNFSEALEGKMEMVFRHGESNTLWHRSWKHIQEEAAWDSEHDGTAIYGKEIRLFFEWLAQHPDWEPFKAEGRYWSARYRLAGSVDMLFRHRQTGLIIVVDWKRSKEIERHNRFCFCRDEHDPAACDAYGIHNLTCSLENCNYNHYSLQLHTYSALLEEHYDMEIGGRYIVVLHPDQDAPLEIEAASLGGLVRMMLEERQRQVETEYGAQGTDAPEKPMIGWSEALGDEQRKGKRLMNSAADSFPRVEWLDAAEHPDYHVTVHLSGTEHDFYAALQPLLWPAGTRELTLKQTIPTFPRDKKHSSSHYTLILRFYEQADTDPNHLNKAAELESAKFRIITHVSQSSKRGTDSP